MRNVADTRSEMIRAEAEVVIDRPVEEVYDFLADATNDPRWSPPVKDCRRVGNPGKGTVRYEATVKPGPKQMTNVFEVSTHQRPERIEWRGSNQMADFDGFYELAQVPGGTQVRMVSDLDVHGPMKLLSPVIAIMSRANAGKQFDRLKAILGNKR